MSAHTETRVAPSYSQSTNGLIASKRLLRILQIMKKRYLIKATCYDKKGTALSVGFNSYSRTHPLQKHFAQLAGQQGKEYIHAELDALLKAKGRQVYSIKIERYGKDGQPMLAKPCATCEQALKAFGVKQVVYTL